MKFMVHELTAMAKTLHLSVDENENVGSPTVLYGFITVVTVAMTVTMEISTFSFQRGVRLVEYILTFLKFQFEPILFFTTTMKSHVLTGLELEESELT